MAPKKKISRKQRKVRRDKDRHRLDRLSPEAKAELLAERATEPARPKKKRATSAAPSPGRPKLRDADDESTSQDDDAEVQSEGRPAPWRKPLRAQANKKSPAKVFAILGALLLVAAVAVWLSTGGLPGCKGGGPATPAATLAPSAAPPPLPDRPRPPITPPAELLTPPAPPPEVSATPAVEPTAAEPSTPTAAAAPATPPPAATAAAPKATTASKPPAPAAPPAKAPPPATPKSPPPAPPPAPPPPPPAPPAKAGGDVYE